MGIDTMLDRGAVGVIVHVHDGGTDYIVEFFDTDGNTIAIEDVHENQMRALTDEDLQTSTRAAV